MPQHDVEIARPVRAVVVEAFDLVELARSHQPVDLGVVGEMAVARRPVVAGPAEQVVAGFETCRVGERVADRLPR